MTAILERIACLGYRAELARDNTTIDAVCTLRSKEFFNDSIYFSDESDRDKFDDFSLLDETEELLAIEKIKRPLTHLIYVEHIRDGIVGTVRLIERMHGEKPELPIENYKILYASPKTEQKPTFTHYLDVINNGLPEAHVFQNVDSQVAGFAIRRDYQGSERRNLVALPLFNLLRKVAMRRKVNNAAILSRYSTDQSINAKSPSNTYLKFGAKVVLPRTWCLPPASEYKVDMPADLMYADLPEFSRQLDGQLERAEALFNRAKIRAA